ncbi:MAG TPA: MFS transporter [Longimicrobiales bacterium]
MSAPEVVPPQLRGDATVPLCSRMREWLGLERNIVLVAGAMLLLGLGENLWKRYVPKYLEALGAPVLAIGAYGSAEDLLDGLYQYPGGWVADRFGRRMALLVFVSLAALGYLVYLVAPAWPWAFVALALVLAWSSMASPTLFAVVGDSLPRGRRAMGFTVQAILRRLPILVAPTLGGLLIAAWGIRRGVRGGLGVSVLLALATLALAARVRVPVATAPASLRGVWRALPRALRWLLTSDILIRACEGLVDIFVVLYATNVLGLATARYGLLVAIEAATAILVYLPAARIADRTGRKLFVTLTFVAFSLFPIAVVLARGFATLALAFVVGGLREIGEPSRKALIVDLAQPQLRARSVGLYYLVRSAAIAPAAFVGGLLWKLAPALPFFVAGGIGLVGTALFMATVSEEGAG